MEKDDLKKLLSNRPDILGGINRDYELEIVRRIVSIDKKLDLLLKKVEEIEKKLSG
ncbi:MAG TPA: hypothetical protein VKU94_07575 [Geobacterales bacterium]|nr:hypothetical protein [Geobacterales bacterium]